MVIQMFQLTLQKNSIMAFAFRKIKLFFVRIFKKVPPINETFLIWLSEKQITV